MVGYLTVANEVLAQESEPKSSSTRENLMSILEGVRRKLAGITFAFESGLDELLYVGIWYGSN
jgi:hypothetical protein